MFLTPMFRAVAKLKLVKQALRTWNKSVSGNLCNNILQSQACLQEIQDHIALEGFSMIFFRKKWRPIDLG